MKKMTCDKCGEEMKMTSHGVFDCEKENSKRVVLEILWYCNNCNVIGITEHRVKPENISTYLSEV